MLNPAQISIITSSDSKILVFAGAGTGKTRVLVSRISFLLDRHSADIRRFLVLTYTNKAARQLRERIAAFSKLGFETWIGTFHSICYKFLRLYWGGVFQVIDGNNQIRIIRDIVRSRGLDLDKYDPLQVSEFINYYKDRGVRSSDFSLSSSVDSVLVSIYSDYEGFCRSSGLLDFSELLLFTYEILLGFPALLAKFRSRFSYIFVDEFQDTNHIQYLLLLILDIDNIFVVGDDDQSIYSWRGSSVQNIHNFSYDFAGAKVYRLDQNYRSTPAILSFANSLIAKNSRRFPKTLWTSAPDFGFPVVLYSASTDTDEAAFVVSVIFDFIRRGYNPADFAILYRLNMQSRLFEQYLQRSNLPYQVVGSLRFFERAEIKDLLAYLRLIVDHNDDDSFLRVVNVPPRHIGDRTIQTIVDCSRKIKSSCWDAALYIFSHDLLPPRSFRAVSAFFSLIDSICLDIQNNASVSKIVELVLQRSGLLDYYSDSRSENLLEFLNLASEFDRDQAVSDCRGNLANFLSHLSLGVYDPAVSVSSGAVQLMTVHASKGLEFSCVFLVGLEDNLFPYAKTLDNLDLFDEERRLCYVAMTRARARLFLSYAELRKSFGSLKVCQPSRFLRDLPNKSLQFSKDSFSLAKLFSALAFFLFCFYNNSALATQPKTGDPVADSITYLSDNLIELFGLPSSGDIAGLFALGLSLSVGAFMTGWSIGHLFSLFRSGEDA